MQKANVMIKRIPILHNFILYIYRFVFAFRYFIYPLKIMIVWLFTSRETSNFTYNLTSTNKRYLASLIADIIGKPYEEIMTYILELDNNIELKNFIVARIKNSPEKNYADLDVQFCRRIGWYAIARGTKPKTIIETGVDKGLGSCVLTAALLKNAEEGYFGFYYGTDINPKAGYLLDGKYKEYGEILYGDSITSLQNLNISIDLFINDSDHSADYEKREYETISQKLSQHAIILGDNSHDTDQLLNFALKTQRQFIFFKETPDKHWYPGAGIGIAFRRNNTLNNLLD